MQVLAFLALFSGALSASARFASLVRIPAKPPVKAFESEEPPKAGPALMKSLPPVLDGPTLASALTPMLAPVAPSAPAGGASLSLKARVPGRWIVDAAGEADADATKLSDILASVKDGDIVLVRPGRYSEAIVIAQSITLRGTGSDRAAVTIDSNGPLTAAVARGRARLEHLTLANSGPMSTTVLAVSKAELALDDVEVRSTAGQGLRVSGGAVDARNCRISGRIALLVEQAGRVRMSRCDINGSETALLLFKDAAGEFTKTRFHDSAGYGVYADPGSSLTLTESTIENNRGCAIAAKGSRIVLKRATLRRSLCGVALGSHVTLEANDSRFENNAQGALGIIAQSDLNTITLRGSGNAGAQMNLVGRFGGGANADARAPKKPSRFRNDIFNPLRKKVLIP